MKTFSDFLAEGKASIAKLKPGVVVTPTWKGRSARNYGIDGQSVYEGKVKVLGLGIVPSGKNPEKKHIIGKDYMDVQKQYKEIWDTEEVRYGSFYNAQDKMKTFFNKIADADKKVSSGWVSWIWEVVDGPNKGKLHYCFIDSDDKWSIAYLNKSAEFDLIS